KKEPARALHVRAEDVPILRGPRHRVRVLLGRSGESIGAQGTPEEMTMLDGYLEKGGRFSHHLLEGRQAWIYAVSGDLKIRCETEERALKAGTATTIEAGSDIEIVFQSSEQSHFVLMAAKPIRESFVKRGPLVMSTEADVQRTLANYADGKFGRIPA